MLQKLTSCLNLQNKIIDVRIQNGSEEHLQCRDSQPLTRAYRVCYVLFSACSLSRTLLYVPFFAELKLFVKFGSTYSISDE